MLEKLVVRCPCNGKAIEIGLIIIITDCSWFLLCDVLIINSQRLHAENDQ